MLCVSRLGPKHVGLPRSAVLRLGRAMAGRTGEHSSRRDSASRPAALRWLVRSWIWYRSGLGSNAALVTNPVGAGGSSSGLSAKGGPLQIVPANGVPPSAGFDAVLTWFHLRKGRQVHVAFYVDELPVASLNGVLGEGVSQHDSAKECSRQRAPVVFDVGDGSFALDVAAFVEGRFVGNSVTVRLIGGGEFVAFAWKGIA